MTTERELLIAKYQQWLDTHPNPSLIAAQCATIAEEYAESKIKLNRNIMKEIIKKLDQLYKEWSGDHHTTNSNKLIHDSAECTDFAEFCLKHSINEGPITKEKLVKSIASKYFWDNYSTVYTDIIIAMEEYGKQQYELGIEDGKMIAEHGTVNWAD